MRMVALLKGINVGGNRKVPMAELREVATACGLAEVSTYIQSGNLVFSASDAAEHVDRALEASIEERFGFKVDVLVRTSEQWRQLLSACPFTSAAEDRPNLLHLCLSKLTPHPDAVSLLSGICAPNEAVALVGDALWVDYAEGVARSKVTLAKLDKAVGSMVTARNFRTVQHLGERLS